jgi:hypothetical protein
MIESGKTDEHLKAKLVKTLKLAATFSIPEIIE